MRSAKHIKTYIRYGIFSLDEILLFIKHKYKDRGKPNRREYLGFKVKMTSSRYHLFKSKGTKCVTCGIEGVFFALEKQRKDNATVPHFNLYGFNDRGAEVMLTKDHIIPKSKGGTDSILNYQVMCIKCNGKKANKLT